MHAEERLGSASDERHQEDREQRGIRRVGGRFPDRPRRHVGEVLPQRLCEHHVLGVIAAQATEFARRDERRHEEGAQRGDSGAGVRVAPYADAGLLGGIRHALFIARTGALLETYRSVYRGGMLEITTPTLRPPRSAARG